jgi:hypothetical protein
MRQFSFKSSYSEISTKINKKDYIKIEKKDKKNKETKGQSLSEEEKSRVFELVNRDLLGSKCDKIDLKDTFYVGRYI